MASFNCIRLILFNIKSAKRKSNIVKNTSIQLSIAATATEVIYLLDNN